MDFLTNIPKPFNQVSVPSKAPKFTIKDFNRIYKTETDCLNQIFRDRFGNASTCPKCNKETKFFRIKTRKCYSCQFCGFQLHPLAGTIFHKSDTDLRLWFYAIYLFSISKNGVSAKELERNLGVTYKCAWRMAKQIRLLFSQDISSNKLKGTVEIDEAYFGGEAKHKVKYDNKTQVVGMVERKGRVIAKVVPNHKFQSVMPLIKQNVRGGSSIMTDESNIYDSLKSLGYRDHKYVKHSNKIYVLGNVHTNTIEGFWGQLKRSISGTYHQVSSKYLQLYVDEFAWRYSYRFSSSPLFSLLILKAAKPV